MTIEDKVKTLREDIARVAESHGASNVRIFGSVARRQSGTDSDLDILVDLAEDRSLLDHVAIQQELEALLGCSVHVVVAGGLSPHLESRILTEARPL
jgi:predicted nucleotidyltransferase